MRKSHEKRPFHLLYRNEQALVEKYNRQLENNRCSVAALRVYKEVLHKKKAFQLRDASELLATPRHEVAVLYGANTSLKRDCMWLSTQVRI